MTQQDDLARVLRQWLASADGHGFIRIFVWKKMPDLKKSGTISTVWQYVNQEGRDDRAELAEEIGQDFLLYLLNFTEAGLDRQPGLLLPLLGGNSRLFLEQMWPRFLRTWRERARSRNENPAGYLYRRFREMVSARAEFTTFRNEAKLLFFSCGPQGYRSAAAIANVLAEESYHDWPLPPQPLREDESNGLRITGAWLAETAVFFHGLAMERHAGCRWFAVKEMVRYLATVQPWLYRPGRYEESRSDPDDEDFLTTIPAVQEESETRFDRLRQLMTIEPLVGQLVANWSRIECCIFAWRLQERRPTLKRIAEKLALANHNQVQTLFEKTQKSIKKFCGSWPGPPLSELAPGVAEVFVEKVREQAKKKCDGP